MSTAILDAPRETRRPRHSATPRQGKVSIRGVLRSEWIKLYSLRSTLVSLATTVIAVIGLGLLFSAVAGGDIGQGSGIADGEAAGDPLTSSMGGVQLSQLVIGVLGVLLMSGEYATGMIRSSLAAVPKRIPVLWGKAAVFSAVSLLAMLVAVFGAFLGGMAIIGDTDVSLDDPGVLRAVIGSAVYLVGVGVLGMALGAILRNTGAAIAAVFGLVLILPVLFPLLPASWNDTVGRYLPSNAGGSFTTVAPAETMLSPWTGLAVFGGYIVIALVNASILLKRRDA